MMWHFEWITTHNEIFLSSLCLQVHLHSNARGPTHDRHNVDHVPEACCALGLEESPQLGETGGV